MNNIHGYTLRSGGASKRSRNQLSSLRKFDLDVAALTVSKRAMHGAAHNSFGACVRRLQRGARRGFATGSSSAASAKTCPRGLRAHRGSCQSEVRSAIVSISLSILGADKSRKRTNTHHPHVFVTCIIRCRVSHTCTPALTKVGHIRRSAVPPAHRRARLGAHDTRPAGAGGLRPPQRAHELRDGRRPHAT